MAPPFKTGQKAVTATAQQLTSDSAPIETLVLKGVSGNTIDVYFGNSSSVTTSTGYPLAANEEFVFSPANEQLKKTPLPSDIYVIASDVGATIAWTATPR